MQWEDTLKAKFSQSDSSDYEEIYKICLEAYAEGGVKEKALAIEAHRLRCVNLLGSHCMCNREEKHPKRCDGKCIYLRQYEFELYNLKP